MEKAEYKDQNYNEVQTAILKIKDKLNDYTLESTFVKDTLIKQHIFVKDISSLIYVKVDEILNSFQKFKGKDEKKICLVMIHMMVMLLTLKNNNMTKIEDINSFNTLVNKTLSDIVDHVIDKNRKYGNSALSPIRIMSSASTVEQLYIRLDDKLNRIINRQNDEDEDIPFDIAGYFILIYVYFTLNEENNK